MNSESKQILNIGDWTIRQRIPAGRGPHPTILMLHGWTGDEESMWVFSSRLPEDSLLLAPRGLYITPLEGYGWHKFEADTWPNVDDFRPAVESLSEILTLNYFPLVDFLNVRILGFSQGAAMGFTFTLLFPEMVQAAAGMSGFLPEDYESFVYESALTDKPIFMTHGIKDKLVPIEMARQSVKTFERAGANITYCEDDVGHKLSATCFKGVEDFFRG